MTFLADCPVNSALKTQKAALIVFWCFHQPITVLTWWQSKHTFVISFFSSSFFHSIRHVHKYPQNRRVLLTAVNLLGILSCKPLLERKLFVQTTFSLLNRITLKLMLKERYFGNYFIMPMILNLLSFCSYSWILIWSLSLKAS